MSKTKLTIIIGLFAAILLIVVLISLITQEKTITTSQVECLENHRGLQTDISPKKLYFPLQLGWEGNKILIRNQNGQPIDSLYPNQICDTGGEGITEKIISVKFNGLRIIKEIEIEE